MISEGVSNCPTCDGELKHYDSVYRIVREGDRKKKKILIRRLKCKKCGQIHRELPVYLMPYKHYTVDVIYGVLKGYISPYTYGFEDNPSEATMKRWRKMFLNRFRSQ